MIQSDKRESVKKLLRMSVKSDKRSDGIYVKKDVIYTGQKYYSLLDEDMSTLAVEFYDIVYGNVLDEARVLADKGRLVDKNFAGDTINC